MDRLNEWLSFADGWLASSAWFPWVLLMVGAWFTIYLGLPQFRFFGRAWKVLFGKTTRKEAPGDTSHFQAMSTALSGTVGTGNIGGVALALAVGGPAAIFWMWATAVVGMTTKFVEVTLSHKYREVDGKGLISGGPMYFMEKRLKMKPLAILFAIATILSALGSGNLPQSRNLAEGVEASFGIPHAVTGLVLAIALALVIVGGIKVIARVTSKIVPLMGFIYALGALAVLVTNFENVVPSFYAIFSSAFTGSAAVGGFLGASFIYACTQGVKRGLFSNEAGQGSAPIAHASARADEPVSEGLVSILEPFIDTLVICTLTAIVILSSGVWKEKFENDFHYTDTKVVVGTYHESNSEQVAALSGLFSGSGDSVQAFNGEVDVVNGRIAGNGFTVLHKRSIAEDVRVYSDDDELYSGSLTIENGKISTDFVLRGKSLLDSVPLTIEAFKRSLFGEFGQYAVSIGLVLFAFSTAIAWSYYGDRAVIYLVGDKWVTPFRIAYSIAFFLAAITDTTIVWAISAVTLALMCLPNLLGITLMSREMKQTVKEYVEQEKAA